MSEDIRLSTGLPQHFKTIKLERRLGAGACWALVKLLIWCADNRPDGNLSGISDEDLELAIAWVGPESLIPILRSIGFLDGGKGNYRIHGWSEHQPYVAAREDRIQRARDAASARWARTTPEQRKAESERLNRSRWHAADSPNLPASSTDGNPSIPASSTDRQGVSTDTPCPPPTTPTTPTTPTQTRLAPGLCEAIVSTWNAERGPLPEVQNLTPGRRKKIQNRLRNNPDFHEKLTKALRIAIGTPFLCGQSKTGWRPNFDWFIANDENFISVLEGKYGNGNRDGATQGIGKSPIAVHSNQVRIPRKPSSFQGGNRA